jgi:general secretion pathway protein E
MAREEARRSGGALIEVLRDKAKLDADAFLRRLAGTVRLRTLTGEELRRCAPDFSLVSYAEAVKRQCVAVRGAEGESYVAIADPFDADLQAWVEARAPEAPEWRLVVPGELLAFLAQQEHRLRAMDSVLVDAKDEAAPKAAREELSLRSIGEQSSPVVKLVSSTLYDALKSGASDVHLECLPGGIAIQYRLDGVLVTAGELEGGELAEQVISRIKVLAELDIAERRVPQDGRFKMEYSSRDIDFRVSIMPSIHGEDAVVRILDKSALAEHAAALTLEALGFDGATLERVRALAAEPYGMLLVTGLTGSGKTTTLYAVIGETWTGRDKIVTIEDPVEYQLPRVLQIPVNEKKGLTFARGLRSILRHDPDRIMVGEIRDPETAEIAVQAALTGHLVYTTVHANNVFDVIGRFIHMNVDTYSFCSALNGVLAQRLIRVNCRLCAVPHEPDARMLARSGLGTDAVQAFRFMRGKGCGECRGTGYRGRRAIGEVLVLSDEIREMIVAREPIRRLKDAAYRSGLRTLRQGALALLAAGETTLEEINRVTAVG